MAQPIVGWFEVTGKDGPALQRISKRSGRSINDAGDDSGYGLVEAGENGIAGGIGASQDRGQGGVTFYAEVDDLAAFLDRAEKIGGTTVVPPTEFPDFGLTFAFFADPGSHIVGLPRGAVQ